MNKNLFLAVALSLFVYMAWYGFVDKRIRPQTPADQPSVGTRQDPQDASRRDASRREASRPMNSRSRPAPGKSPAAVQSESEAEPGVKKDQKTLRDEAVRVQLGDTQMFIHPQGAGIVSCLFDGPMGQVELVHDPVPGLFATWPDLRFEKTSSRSGTTSFSAVRRDGMVITKDFVWQAGDALPHINVRLSNPTDAPLASGSWEMSVGPGLSTVPTEKKENEDVWRAIGLTRPGKGTRGRVEEFDPGSQETGFRWVAVDNRYFLAAVLAPQVFEKIVVGKPPHLRLSAGGVVIAPGQEHAWDIPFYLGPKAHNRLAELGVSLERSIDLGFFSSLGRLILKILGMLHGVTGNWGWAVILLTVVVQIVLFPLSYKTLKSAAAMKKLQPQIARLQQIYGKDPQKLNSEMMELYKRSGANPLGGCLPMLLQLPVFIALFNALRNSWELHGAHWIFWVTDLSAKDPYYVLPVVMGGLMFLQNKLSPSAPTDPTQAKMMTWLPVIFTFMFLKFPAGLVLYWLTNSIITVIEQMALRDHFEKADMTPSRFRR